MWDSSGKADNTFKYIYLKINKKFKWKWIYLACKDTSYYLNRELDDFETVIILYVVELQISW